MAASSRAHAVPVGQQGAPAIAQMGEGGGGGLVMGAARANAGRGQVFRGAIGAVLRGNFGVGWSDAAYMAQLLSEFLGGCFVHTQAVCPRIPLCAK